MQLVHVYVNFPGTTREALEFYETVFNTKIAMIQTFGEATFMPNVPELALLKVSIEAPEAYRAQAESFGLRLKHACFSSLSTAQAVVIGMTEILGAVLPPALLAGLSWLTLRAVRRRSRAWRARANRASLASEDSGK